MKDEIKEIINQLEIVARIHTIEVCEDGSKIETMSASVVDELRLNNYTAKILLDYKNNLQEENERLTQGVTLLTNKVIDMTKAKEDYKSRNEKAIEELDKYINSCEIEAEHTLNNEKCLISVRHSKKVKNILQGEDKE